MNAPATIRPVGTVFTASGARVAAHLSFASAVDNRRGRGQTIVTGTAELIEWPDRPDGFVGVTLRIVGGLDLFPDAERARYLIADDASHALFYVATYHRTERNIGLKTLTPGPFDPESDGPCRLYTLRVTARYDTPESE